MPEAQRSNVNVKQILEYMVKVDASDLHLKVGLPPVLRVNGSLVPMKMPPLSSRDLQHIAASIMTKEQRDKFSRYKELDFAIGVQGLARFRVNVFMQRGTIAIAMRTVPYSVRTIDELNLPPVLKDLSLKSRGLILVTGTTGSGKSTTLAAMIEHINQNVSKHIITIEDPIELLFRDKKSIIAQRELGADTQSFATALRYVLRQDPDVILIGEIRDVETMDTALKAADTGHLVLSTLHTLNAAETINRIISFYPPHQQEHIRVLLSATLVGVISQRLLPRADGKGRVPAVEVLICTAMVRDYILDAKKTLLIPQAIEEGRQYHMQSFDQAILDLYKEGLVRYEDAIVAVTNPDEFNLRLRGITGASDRF